MRKILRRERSPLAAVRRRPAAPTGWAAVGVLVLAAVLPYLNSFHGSFQFDDILEVEWNNALQSLDRTLADGPTGRVLTRLTLYANYRLHGLEFLPGWHAVNVLLHAACVLAVYWAMRLVTARKETPLPFFAAALFAVHPLASEPVNYIQARAVTLYTLFSVLALCGAAILHRGETRRRKVAGAALLVGSVLLAALSKEVGVFFALALPALYTGAFVAAEVENKKRFWLRAGIGAGATLGAGGLWLLAAGMWGSIARRMGSLFWYHLWGQVIVFWRYVSLALCPLPSRLSVDHYVPFPRFRMYGPLDGDVAAAVLGMVLLAAVTAWCLRRRRDVSFFLALLPVGIAPYFVMTTAEMMVEYRFYLPLIGFCGLVGALLARLEGRRRWLGTGCLAAVCVAGCAGTLARNTAWRTEVALWEDAYRKAPQKARTMSALAWALARDKEHGDPKRALELARKALRPNDPNLVPWPGFNPCMHDTLAEAYYANEMYAEAVRREESILRKMERDGNRIAPWFFRRQLAKFRAALAQSRSPTAPRTE